MVEYTSLKKPNLSKSQRASRREKTSSPRGAEAKRGSLLLDRGTRLNEAAIALAASVGKSRLQVFVRPRVAVLTTGDEIVEIDAEPGPTQIRNSNSYSLAVQIQQAGGEPVLLPDRSRRAAPSSPTHRTRPAVGLAVDDRRRLHGTLRSGRASARRNASRILLHRRKNPTRPPGSIRPMQSARALAGALAREGASAPASIKYFFGLPGNPLSTMVTFELFASPMLEALAGAVPAATHLPARSLEIRNPRQARTDALPPRNSFRPMSKTRRSNSCPGKDPATSPPEPARIATSSSRPIASTSPPATGSHHAPVTLSKRPRLQPRSKKLVSAHRFQQCLRSHQNRTGFSLPHCVVSPAASHVR